VYFGWSVMWNWFAVVILTFSIGLFSIIDSQAQQRPSGYTEAEAAFKKLTPEERVYVQTLMTAVGYWNAVPNVDFSARIFDAVKRLQSEIGKEQDGKLGAVELAQLERDAAPVIRKWGFRQVRHPDRPISIWVPFGLKLKLNREKFGLSYHGENNDIIVNFNYYSVLNLNITYDGIMKDKMEKGTKVHFSVIRPQFYVIASTTASGIDVYERFQREGDGIIGFQLSWSSNNSDLKGATIGTMISSSLYGQYNRIPLSPPERLLSQRYQAVATAPPQAASNPATPPPSPPVSAKREGSTGTGFVVTSGGSIVTNAHVIENCSSVEISTPDHPRLSARLVARDDINDIALLSSPELKPKDVVAVRNGVKLGEQVVAFGYPLTGVLSVSGNFTLGNVTSLAGLSNDSRYLQISTPVQPGNSGGPLLDQHGNVVGIVSSKLNALRTAIVTGDIPQNVNFALKIGTASNLLETSSVNMTAGSTAQVLTAVELADRAKRVSVQVHCRP
jgi:serine protease Do